MKRRRKFELAIADLQRALAHPELDDRYGALFHGTWNLYPFIEGLAESPQKVGILIDVTRSAREATGAGRDTAEEKLMQHLDGIARVCCAAIDDAGFDRFLQYPDCDDCPAELTAPFAILRDLCAYALDCFEYTRPRDQFAGMRRAAAFEILGTSGWAFDLPAAVPLALAALKRDRRLEARGAIAFLEDYFKVREGNPIPDEIVDTLLSFAERTDNRSNATGALNVLVETGVITELHALSRLDEWKERHPWA